MPFKPNDYVLDQMLTLIELWKDKSRNQNSKLTDSMPTKKFLGMIKSAPSKELFIKYWENVPAIQELLEKPNFDEVKLKSEDIEEPQEMQPMEPVPAGQELPLGEPEDMIDQIPGTDMADPGQVGAVAEPAAEPVAAEPQAAAGPSPKDIVSQMATRRKNRVMEARKNLRKLR